MKAEKYYEKF